MNPKLILLALAVVACAMADVRHHKTSYTDYKLLDIYPLTQEQVNLVGELQHNPDFDLWSEHLGHPDGVKVSLSPEAFEKYAAIFDIYKIKYNIVEDNLQKRFDAEAEMMRQSAAKAGKNIHGRYVRYADHMNYILDIVDMYPNFAKTYVAGRSHEGRDMRVLVLYGKTNPTRKIWVDCGIHAREWVTPATCAWIINKIVTDYHNNVADVVTILDRFEFHIMPLHNPDGYEFSHTTTRLWRKNRRSGSCIGVDLNRNFPDHWNTGGASTNPCADTYCGTAGGSEPETQAVIKSLNDHLGQWDIFFTIHSYGKWVFTPFGWSTTILPANYAEQVEKAQIMGRAIMNTYGQTGWTWGSSAQLLYVASGGSDDTSFAMGVKYNHCLELRPGQTGTDSQYGFTLPEDRAPLAGEETWVGMKALINAVIAKP